VLERGHASCCVSKRTRAALKRRRPSASSHTAACDGARPHSETEPALFPSFVLSISHSNLISYLNQSCSLIFDLQLLFKDIKQKIKGSGVEQLQSMGKHTESTETDDGPQPTRTTSPVLLCVRAVMGLLLGEVMASEAPRCNAKGSVC
jgi:hypothetical protein